MKPNPYESLSPEPLPGGLAREVLEDLRSEDSRDEDKKEEKKE